MAFGEALRQRRTSRGLSLTELSRLANYSKGYLSKVETGEKPVTFAIAQACDVALEADGKLLDLVRGTIREQFSLRPSQLPAESAGFVGRHAEKERLDEFRAGGAAVVTISGAPGVGKTALAVHWAHSMRARFPGGTLFANLRGYDPQNKPVSAEDVLDYFLRALNIPAEIIPNSLEGRASLFRTRLDRRGVLVVLDNAISADQVRPLLPSSPDCLVVVTSRASLSGLVAREGARRLVLDALPRLEAVALLRHGIGDERAHAEATAVDVLAGQCAYHPLALRIAAERAGSRPHLRLSDLVRDLDDERGRLDVLTVTDDASTAVRTVFSWSYRALPEDAARLFRLLGLHVGPEFSGGAAAALLGEPPRAAGRLLTQLSSVHLIAECGQDRFRFHDLVRLYAREQAAARETAESREGAIRRVVTWYLRSAAAATGFLAPPWHPPLTAALPDELHPATFTSHREALTWCETECENVVAATRQAYDHGLDDLAWKLPIVLWDYFHVGKRWTLWIESHEIALAASVRTGDRRAEAWARLNLGLAHTDLRRFDESFEYLRSAFAIREEQGDEWGRAWVDYALGIASHAVARHDTAGGHYRRALSYFDGSGDLLGQALCLAGLADLSRERGALATALDQLSRSVTMFRELRDRHGEGYAGTKLAAVLREAGQSERALEYVRESVTISRQAGDHQGEALALDSLAAVLDDLGEHTEALDSRRQAVEILEALGDPRTEDVLARYAAMADPEPDEDAAQRQ
ncbi:ATP-binding protein [Amycolatopsis minnesotensis]|uniref:HTH cro/C1-type domain-containing protein n=1 Tax=Amycolatopsis minnesotensis TaxID=337894 RepID=A0ABP5DWW8_9PSEU